MTEPLPWLILLPLAWATAAFLLGPGRGAWLAIAGIAVQCGLTFALAGQLLAEGPQLHAAGGWYVYAIGAEPPVATVSADKLQEFIAEIDVLLRKEHGEDYCGIVYTDSFEQPAFVKIFDPHNLGVSCGYSDNPPLPGWILSKLQPIDLNAPSLPGNRRRWWQRLFQ